MRAVIQHITAQKEATRKEWTYPTEFEAFALNELCQFSGAFCNSLHCDEIVFLRWKMILFGYSFAKTSVIAEFTVPKSPLRCTSQSILHTLSFLSSRQTSKVFEEQSSIKTYSIHMFFPGNFSKSIIEINFLYKNVFFV